MVVLPIEDPTIPNVIVEVVVAKLLTTFNVLEVTALADPVAMVTSGGAVIVSITVCPTADPPSVILIRWRYCCPEDA
jgi:hypothetical protein